MLSKMMTKHIVFLLLFFRSISSISIELTDGTATLSIETQEDRITLAVNQNGVQKLTADLGTTLPVTDVTLCPDIENCLQFSPETRLVVTNDISGGFSLLWTSSNVGEVLQDCYDLNTTNTNWFGGPERWTQKWPIEKLILKEYANVLSELDFGAIAEPYWLNSHGAYIYVHERTPLFIDQNNMRDGSVCFYAKLDKPYIGRSRVLLHYTIGVADNVREAHLHAVEAFLGKPTTHPNEMVIRRPIWSTWARYQRPISDEIVLIFANEIIDNGYPDGQMEIDDFWETCYGSLTFRTPEFSDITNTVQTLKSMNFRVTLWVHPFVNIDCTEYTEIGLDNDFFAKNESGSVLTKWWNSGPNEAQYIDFTKPEAVEWYISRLKTLQADHGLDSFKVDAGETSWAPQVPVLNADPELCPNILTQEFAKAIVTFGDLMEMRVGWKTQYMGVMVRMIDKDSVWGDNNGLYTLITTLLQMNINGYTMVLPDMIGGNGYGGAPGAELFVRWLQATTFMPTLQFSFVPWDYKDETSMDVLAIGKEFVELHANFTPEILRAMDNSIQLGHPVNGPVWFIDPENPAAAPIDTQYLLGEDVVVAPVIQEGARSRDVFLPSGTWVDGNTGDIYEGSVVLEAYNAPIEVLPYFVRQNSNAHSLIKNK